MFKKQEEEEVIEESDIMMTHKMKTEYSKHYTIKIKIKDYILLFFG